MMKVLFLSMLLFLGVLGCTTHYELIDWNVDSDRVTVLGTRALPEEYPGQLEHSCDLVRMSIVPATRWSQLRKIFRMLGTNDIQSVVRLSNGKEIPVRMGFPGNYFPYGGIARYKGVSYALSGGSFIRLTKELEEDDRLFMSFWRELSTKPVKVDPIPQVDRDTWPWFLLVCDAETTYGVIEKYLIEAQQKGFYAVFIVGI